MADTTPPGVADVVRVYDDALPALSPRELAAVLNAALARYEAQLLALVDDPTAGERRATVVRRADDARASIAAMALATERDG